MEIEKAKEIVSLLANGINPLSGEIYPPNSIYNNPLIKMSISIVLNAADNTKTEQKIKTKPKASISEKQRKNIENGKPKNAGLPWTKDLKLELYLLFDKNKSINDLADHFGRTRDAILAELTHQGIIKKEDYSKYKD